METLNPCMTIQVSGPFYRAFVVVDSIYNGTCSGGVRIVEDVRLQEIEQLAREMTLKYSLFQLGRGGAKAGIALEPEIDSTQRSHALRDFGGKLGTLMRAGIYNPGMDMNCGPEDLRAIYAGAGIGIGTPTDTSYFTAVSVGNAVASVAESLQKAPCSLAIAGFGRVASHLALRLPRDQFRILAVSTVEGGLRLPEDLDPDSLVRARDRWGDAFVAHLSGEPLTHEQVLTESVDILVPAARTGVVTLEIARQSRARAIVPIANFPYAPGALEALHAAGIVCLPGYLVNGGGVLGSSLADLGASKQSVDDFFDTSYRQSVDALLRSSIRTGRPVHELAESVAKHRARMRARQPARRGLWQKIDGKLQRRYPKVLRLRRAVSQYRQALDSIVSDIHPSGISP